MDKELNQHIICKNCKHNYSYFKQTKDELGNIDFLVIPRCRLDKEIDESGKPKDPTCFESRI